MPASLAARTRASREVTEAGRVLQFDQAQRAYTSAGGVWVLYGQDRMCAVQARGGALTCLATRLAVKQGLVLGLFIAPARPTELPNNFLVLGIAPDWARVARLRIGQREIREIPIRGNAYALRARQPIHLERLEP